MLKMTKSWAVTVTAFIVAIAAPIADGPLAEYGIIISEKDIEHFLYLMFGIGATGVAAKGGKKLIERKTPVFTPPKKGITLRKGEVLRPTPGGDGHDVFKDEVFVTHFDKDCNEMPQKPLKTDQAENPKYTGHERDWFRTDLEYQKGVGAVVRRGDPFLWIRAEGAEHIKGRIMQKDRLMQGEQGQEDLRFEIYTKTSEGEIIQWENGEYEFFFSAWINNAYKTGHGKFTIIE